MRLWSGLCLKSRLGPFSLIFGPRQVISVSPDRYSHAAVIAACDRASHWQRACGLLASWDQRSGEKDTVIFNAAIGACATCEQWQQSLQLLLGDVEGHGASTRRVDSAGAKQIQGFQT